MTNTEAPMTKERDSRSPFVIGASLFGLCFVIGGSLVGHSSFPRSGLTNRSTLEKSDA
jgi:hypothetical protein